MDHAEKDLIKDMLVDHIRDSFGHVSSVGSGVRHVGFEIPLSSGCDLNIQVIKVRKNSPKFTVKSFLSRPCDGLPLESVTMRFLRDVDGRPDSLVGKGKTKTELKKLMSVIKRELKSFRKTDAFIDFVDDARKSQESKNLWMMSI